MNKNYNELIIELVSKDKGSPSEFFFMVTHDVKLADSSNGDFDIFDNLVNPKEIFLKFPENPDWKQVRSKVTEFVSNHKDKIDIQFSQMGDQDILSSLHLDSKLSSVIQTTFDLVKSFDAKIEFGNALFKLFQPEFEVIKKEAKEMHAIILKNNGHTPIVLYQTDQKIDQFINDHSVFKLAQDAISDRMKKIKELIFKPSDNASIKYIDESSVAVKFFLVKFIIKIDHMIKFNLDESLDLSFMTGIK